MARPPDRVSSPATAAADRPLEVVAPGVGLVEGDPPALAVDEDRRPLGDHRAGSSCGARRGAVTCCCSWPTPSSGHVRTELVEPGQRGASPSSRSGVWPSVTRAASGPTAQKDTRMLAAQRTRHLAHGVGDRPSGRGRELRVVGRGHEPDRSHHASGTVGLPRAGSDSWVSGSGPQGPSGPASRSARTTAWARRYVAERRQRAVDHEHRSRPRRAGRGPPQRVGRDRSGWPGRSSPRARYGRTAPVRVRPWTALSYA